jgi:acetolactate synthase-1/3 small subunit
VTISTSGDTRTVEQITKQLNKLIEVIRVTDLSEFDFVERELMLVKVRAEGAGRDEVKRMADIFRAQIVDVAPTCYTVQVTGPSEKLDAFIGALSKLSILEVVRSGVSGIARGERVLGV